MIARLSQAARLCREAGQRLLAGLADRLGAAPRGRAVLALAGAGCALAAGGLVAARPDLRPLLLAVPLVLLLRAVLEAVDRRLAAADPAPAGVVVREVAALVADAALYLPLALVPGVDPRMAVVTVVLILIAEASGLAGALVGAGRGTEGPLDPGRRGLVLGALAAALAGGADPRVWTDLVLAGVAIAAALTAYHRTAAAARRGRRA